MFRFSRNFCVLCLFGLMLFNAASARTFADYHNAGKTLSVSDDDLNNAGWLSFEGACARAGGEVELGVYAGYIRAHCYGADNVVSENCCESGQLLLGNGDTVSSQMLNTKFGEVRYDIKGEITGASIPTIGGVNTNLPKLNTTTAPESKLSDRETVIQVANEHGDALKGCEIWSSDGTVETAKTDRKGRATLKLLGKPDGKLRIECDGYQTVYGKSFDDLKKEAVIRMKEKEVINVRVVNEEGKGLDGCKISLDNSLVDSTRTDKNGKAKFVLPGKKNERNIKIECDGYLRKTMTVDEFKSKNGTDILVKKPQAKTSTPAPESTPAQTQQTPVETHSDKMKAYDDCLKQAREDINFEIASEKDSAKKQKMQQQKEANAQKACAHLKPASAAGSTPAASESKSGQSAYYVNLSDDTETLVGVTVSVCDSEKACQSGKGCTAKGATDGDGNYSLSVDANKYVCFTYVGMKNKAVRASTLSTNQNSPTSVVMATDSNKLKEVTAVGCKANNSKGVAKVEPDENGKCVVIECLDGYAQNDKDNTKCDKITKCSANDASVLEKKDHVKKTKLENGKCVVASCDKNYKPNDTKDGCIQYKGDCSADDDEALKKKDTNVSKTKLEGNQCVVAACNKGYKPNDAGDGCTQTKGDCDPGVEHATGGEMKKGKCVVTVCSEGYHPSKDGTKCEGAGLSKEQSQARVDELKENAKKMKEKEQSLENRLLGAAAMGTMGKSGADLASGMAEKKADEAAERDMKAYLATFTCEYGGGKRVAGGESNVELPGGNDLFALANEYKSLALDLKERKTALGLRAGIESEEIIDPATSGLYDNVGIGRQGGAYTSLARALTDKNSEDAKAWEQQKADTASKIKNAKTTLGVAAVASVAANLALNNKDSKKNKADEINKKYRDMMTQPLADLEQDVKKGPESNPKSCDGGSSGNYPNCSCAGTNAVYNGNNNTCDDCGNDRTANKSTNVCEKKCVNGTYDADKDVCNCKPGWQGDLCNDEIKNNVNGKPQINVTQCTNNKKLIDGVCKCEKGFDGPKCDCDLTTHVYSGDKCAPRTSTSDLKAVLPAKNLFENNSFELTSAAKQALSKFAKDVGKMVSENVGIAYCVRVVGHTDKTGGKSYNKTLSEKRANAVKEYLVSRSVRTEHIESEGRGWDECPTNGKNDDCRRVDITSEDKNCDGSGGTSESVVQKAVQQITGTAPATSMSTAASGSGSDDDTPTTVAGLHDWVQSHWGRDTISDADATAVINYVNVAKTKFNNNVELELELYSPSGSGTVGVNYKVYFNDLNHHYNSVTDGKMGPWYDTNRATALQRCKDFGGGVDGNDVAELNRGSDNIQRFGCHYIVRWS